MTLSYLATPYTNFPGGLQAAFRIAAKLTAALIRSGVNVYSPIAHTHPAAVYGGLDPLDHAIWMKFDEVMMERCDTLIVAHLTTWERSKGVAHEIAFFERAGKPIFDLNPRTMAMVKRSKPA